MPYALVSLCVPQSLHFSANETSDLAPWKYCVHVNYLTNLLTCPPPSYLVVEPFSS